MQTSTGVFWSYSVSRMDSSFLLTTYARSAYGQAEYNRTATSGEILKFCGSSVSLNNLPDKG